MKSALVLATAIIALCSASAVQAAEPYVGFAGTVPMSRASLGGFNTAGPATNIGSDHDINPGLSAVIGAKDLFRINPKLALRAEAEFNWSSEAHFNTAVPSLGTYETDSKSYGGFLNAYLDYNLSPLVTVFVGGGAGLFHHDIDTQDGVVEGSGQDSRFAYNLGGGGMLSVSDNLDVVLGLRYLNLGESFVPLTALAGGAPSGDFKVHHSSIEARVGVNYSFGSIF